MKVQKSVGSETSREEHWPRCLQHSTSHNSSETSYYNPLMEAGWPENHHPTYIPPFQCQHFSFPIDINFSKSVIHLYQPKYWNTLFLDFHYHSAHIKFHKINSFLSIQLWTFSSQFHGHSHIHQHNCLNLLFLLC